MIFDFFASPRRAISSKRGKKQKMFTAWQKNIDFCGDIKYNNYVKSVNPRR